MAGLRMLAWIMAAAALQISAPALGAQVTDGSDAALIARLKAAGCYRETPDEANDNGTGALEAAIASCPDQAPVLRIETGMHVAMINRIGADRACHLAATGSDDKTVRLWSLPDGHLIRTQRLPIGPGSQGKIYAVAVSPDGRYVAAAGWDAFKPQDDNGVYLFDAATGENVRRLGDFGNVIYDLAFSPDGARLGVGLANEGVRILDVASGDELMADDDYEGDSYGVAFGPDGAFYAAALDGHLRRYGPDERRTAKVATPGGKQAYGIAVSPDGRRLAVGYDEAPVVELFDAATLAFVAKADTSGIGGDRTLSSVGWSGDGRRLVAGGTHRVGRDERRVLRSFDADGHRVGADAPVGDNTITSVTPCGDGVAFASADPTFGLLGPNGVASVLARDHRADMRGKTDEDFTVSDDGTRVRFGLGFAGERPVLFDLAAGTLTGAPGSMTGLHEPDISGLKVADWLDDEAPTLAGRRLPLSEYETSRSLAVRPDREGFVLGTDWSLRDFDAGGTQLWRVPVPATTWGVNLAGGGDLVVAAHSDGTIRWYRGSDGQELLALFVDAQDRRFVAWTPSGYYMASPGAEDLIGWQINRGWTQPAEFLPASRQHERFERPDVVRLILEVRDEAEALRRADAAVAQRR